MIAPSRVELEGRVTVPDHVRFRQFDDELVLVDLAGGEYFSLNRVGTQIWREAVSGKTPSEIASSLVGHYAVEEDILLRDCLELLDELLDRRLLMKASPPQSGGATMTP
jgi:hypothetical protein